MLFPSHHIKLIYCHGDITVVVNLDGLAVVVLVRSLHCEITLLPPFFSCCILWEEVIIHCSHLRSGSNAPSPSGKNIYINYLEFFCTGNLFDKYLFNHLYQYILMGNYFILWVIT